MSINTPVITDQRPRALCPFCLWFTDTHTRDEIDLDAAGQPLFTIADIPCCIGCCKVASIDQSESDMIDWLLQQPAGYVTPEVHTMVERAYNQFFGLAS